MSDVYVLGPGDIYGTSMITVYNHGILSESIVT
jgi:hypothetical protein